MRPLCLIAAGAALVGAYLYMAQADDRRKNPKAELMRKKLASAQVLLEGLAIQDFQKLERSADELSLISKTAEWRVLNTPEYSRYSEELRRHCGDIAVAARRKNIDAATLGYVKLTTTCVECHKHLRENKIALRDRTADPHRSVHDVAMAK